MKLKTHKGAAKRFKKTKTGKITHRTSGQSHFNARESGKTTKNKRSDSTLDSSNNRLKQLIAHL